jgi:glucose-6-phosphate 1-epimerase
MTVVSLVDYGSLPAVQLTAPDGACAIITLYGAHLVSWRSADGQERLFCSALSKLDGSRPIRGGVPVIFPQFAEQGDGMRHGFARVSTWRASGSGLDGAAAWATFALTEADVAPAMAQAWPHRFALALRVMVVSDTLHITLEVRNHGDDSFAFASALHSYFHVADLADVGIDGVQAATLAIADKFDHIYRDVEGEIAVATGAGTLTLTQSGFRDAVVWNPGAADAAALADLEDAEYRRFVCVEAALIAPLTLAPGASWHGHHGIVAA